MSDKQVADLAAKIVALEAALNTTDTSHLRQALCDALAPGGIVHVELLTSVFECRYKSPLLSNAQRAFATRSDGSYESALVQSCWEMFQISVSKLLSLRGAVDQ
jgi:hypothetical protein